MTCNSCQNASIFKEKLGRCQRCMNQLMMLSPLSWAIWWFGFSDDPKEMMSITILFAAGAFTLLLLAHFWMKFVVIPNRKHTHS